MSSTVHCIILTVNGYAFLRKSIASLFSAKRRGLTVTVVDNGSSEPIGELLRRDFPGVRCIRSETNLGFAEGNNLAIRTVIREGAPDVFLLFNNDAVADRNLFVTCLPVVARGFDLVSPTIMLDGGRGIDNAGIEYYRSGFAHGRLTQPDERTLVSGCCLFLSRRFVKHCLATTGWLFNPMFFSYAEDLELALRSGLMGYRQTVLPDPLVLHRRTATLGDLNPFRLYISWRNLLWVIVTTWPFVTIVGNLRHILAGQIVALASYAWERKYLMFPKIYASTVWHLPGLLMARGAISRSVRDNTAVDRLFTGDIARWSVYFANRKVLLFARAFKRFFRWVRTSWNTGV